MNFNKVLGCCWGILFLCDVIAMICNGYEPTQSLRGWMSLCLAMTNWELGRLKEQ